MILLWYILIPAVAAPLAWLFGRRQPLAARWIAVAGTAAPLVLLVVVLHVVVVIVLAAHIVYPET